MASSRKRHQQHHGGGAGGMAMAKAAARINQARISSDKHHQARNMEQAAAAESHGETARLASTTGEMKNKLAAIVP